MQTSHISSLIPLITILLLTYCSADRTEKHSFKVEEIDGILTAVNTGGPKYSEELFQYEKILEIQQDENQPESLLGGAVPVFLMDSHGFYYAEDSESRRIAVYDPEGQYVRSIGLVGEGPGEFGEFWDFDDLRGDVLYVSDSGKRRITRFHTGGTLIDVISFPAEVAEASNLSTVEGPALSEQYLMEDGG